MADTFRNHISCLLNVSVDTFGETIEYRPLKGAAFCFTGVYDDRFESVDPDTEQVVITFQPNLGIKLSDLGATLPQKGDKIILKRTSQKFRVIEVRRDGHGGADLIMHEVL